MPRSRVQELDDHAALLGLLGTVAGLLAARTLPPAGVAAIRCCLADGGAVADDADADELVRAVGSLAVRLSEPTTVIRYGRRVENGEAVAARVSSATRAERACWTRPEDSGTAGAEES